MITPRAAPRGARAHPAAHKAPQACATRPHPCRQMPRHATVPAGWAGTRGPATLHPQNETSPPADTQCHRSVWVALARAGPDHLPPSWRLRGQEARGRLCGAGACLGLRRGVGPRVRPAVCPAVQNLRCRRRRHLLICPRVGGPRWRPIRGAAGLTDGPPTPPPVLQLSSPPPPLRKVAAEKGKGCGRGDPGDPRKETEGEARNPLIVPGKEQGGVSRRHPGRVEEGSPVPTNEVWGAQNVSLQ